MSTVASTVKLQMLNQKWVQKKDSGNALSKAERNERANWTNEQWLLHNLKEQNEQDKEAETKTKIADKIAYGGTLTADEEAYLEQNDPTLLQKYRQTKAEKHAYEEKLRNCKTKDEVQRLKTETVGGYLAALKKVENNPCIPMGEKVAKAQELLAKTRNIEDAERKFMQTAAYQSLPTEAEEDAARAKETREEHEAAAEQIKESTENGEPAAEETVRDAADAVSEAERILQEEKEEQTGNIPQAKDDEAVNAAPLAGDSAARAADVTSGKAAEPGTDNRAGAARKDEDMVKNIEDACRRIRTSAAMQNYHHKNLWISV